MLSGIKSNKIYLYGTRFEVVTDHKPLVPLYNSSGRPLPVRVDRHKSKLLGFDFTVIYEPGLQNPCDFTSRHPEPLPMMDGLTDQDKEDLGIEEDSVDSTFSVNRVIMQGPE